jgi:squalene cyclase
MEMKNIFDSKVIDDAIEKGINYLFSKNVNGQWRGFPTLAGESDIWVTGFVLAHIYNLCEQQDAIKEPQKFLLRSRHSSGGWSYSAKVPPDADSTSWCLMALHSCKELSGLELEKATTFLWSHFTNPGVSTYGINSGIREFISAPDNETIAGWTSIHSDVSIAAVLADKENGESMGILNWLSNLQTNTGFFNAYWWRGPHYTTTLLLRALTQLKLQLPFERATKIAAALANAQLSDGGFGLDSSTNKNSFTTALALESFSHLSYLRQDKESANCGKALLNLQNENGGWSGDYILRIPTPFVIDPNQVESWSYVHGGGNCFIEDKDGIFATAMACYALALSSQTELQKDVPNEESFCELTATEKNNNTPL